MHFGGERNQRQPLTEKQHKRSGGKERGTRRGRDASLQKLSQNGAVSWEVEEFYLSVTITG